MVPGRRYGLGELGRIVWRRRWVMLASIVATTAAAAAALRYLPAVYQAESTIIVEAAVAPGAAGPAALQERLRPITQHVTSGAALAPIIEALDLYAQERRTASLDGVMARMRDDITVRVERADAIVVAFRADDPEIARRVTDRLASLVVEAASGPPAGRAGQPQSFDAIVEDARMLMAEHEKRLEEFRIRHASEMPKEAQSNFQTLRSLQMQAQTASDALAVVRDRQRRLERALGGAQNAAPGSDPRAATAAAQDDVPSAAVAEQQLASMRTALENLRARLSPDHPDVLRAERVVADLETLVAEAHAAAPVAPPPPPPPASPAASPSQVAALQDELAAVTRDLANRERQVAEIESRIESYRLRLEAAPARESELAALVRDYDTSRRVYSALIARRDQANRAASSAPAGNPAARVLVAARRPDAPVTPSRRLLVAAGAGAGVLLGLLLVAILEIRDRTVRTEQEAMAALNLPVLAAVPRLKNPYDRRRRIRGFGAAAPAAAAAVVQAMAAAGWWR